MFITASIVLYNSNIVEIDKILARLGLCKVFLIDNSPENLFGLNYSTDKVNYIHNPSNPGFGAAHNIALEKAIELGSKYHFIINPDVFFEEGVIRNMVEVMEKDEKIGMLMPQILNLDGTTQHLPKFLPSPFSIILRKLKMPKIFFNLFINKYELRNVPKDKIYNSPIISGCFALLNLKAIKEIGMYDDNYFMYFEDWDLSRRMHLKYNTLYYPMVSVYHGYNSGANKDFKLFKIFIISAVYYFNKWGWFFDKERKRINKSALSQFE